jgi:hypothetical protein
LLSDVINYPAYDDLSYQNIAGENYRGNKYMSYYSSAAVMVCGFFISV